MPQLLQPKTKVKVVAREGEIEITLNINITLDGKVVATVENATVVDETLSFENERAPHIIPEFLSGMKLNFGKNEGD